jgi:L-aminopeptidase/D-esterase-like protein
VGEDGLEVGALVAVNSWGSAVMPGTGCFWAWALEQQSEFGGPPPPRQGADADPLLPAPPATAALPGANTTIGVLATNATLSKAEAQRIAIMAQDGFARALRPAHTPFDGDTLFVLATGRHALAEPRPYAIARLGALAADCVARAVARGVFAAEPLGIFPSWRQRYGGGS